MNEEVKSIVKKTAKIAGATCFAAGAVALVTSVAALKAVSEGAKYLKDTVKKIIDEEPKDEPAGETTEMPEEEKPAGETAEAPQEEPEVQEEPVAQEEEPAAQEEMPAAEEIV